MEEQANFAPPAATIAPVVPIALDEEMPTQPAYGEAIPDVVSVDSSMLASMVAQIESMRHRILELGDASINVERQGQEDQRHFEHRTTPYRRQPNKKRMIIGH